MTPSLYEYEYRTETILRFKEPPVRAQRSEGSTKLNRLKIGFNINDTSQVLDIEVEGVSLAYSYRS